MFLDILSKLARNTDLLATETAWVMEGIVAGRLSDDEIAQFLSALREKGESELEISSAVGVLGQHAVKLSRPYPDLLDTCGTGGDGRSTLNVSTLAALVACAAGARIGKHGNRAVSGKTGSADLLELLGIKIDLPPALWEEAINEIGFAFFFAPLYHPAVRQASAARKKVSGKTLFNVLGPLLNPARAERRLMGVYDKRLLGILGPALQRNGAAKVLVVRGQDGLDEISLTGKTDAVFYKFSHGKSAENLVLDPEKAGLQLCRPEDLVCRTPEESLRDAQSILRGEPGPKMDWTVLNAGAALWVAGKAADLKTGVERASATVSSGAAMSKLHQIIKFTHKATHDS